MCDDDNDATPAFDAPDSVRQRLVARIQIGIGFVADEEKWIAVQNSSENNSLTLPCRQVQSVVAHLGLVAVVRFNNHVMYVGRPRSRNDCFIMMIAENAGYDLNLRAEDQHKWYMALEAGFRAEDLTPLSASREKRLTEPTWDRQV